MFFYSRIQTKIDWSTNSVVCTTRRKKRKKNAKYAWWCGEENAKRNRRKIAAKNKYDKKTMEKNSEHWSDLCLNGVDVVCSAWRSFAKQKRSKLCIFIYFELIVVYIWNMWNVNMPLDRAFMLFINWCTAEQLSRMKKRKNGFRFVCFSWIWIDAIAIAMCSWIHTPKNCYRKCIHRPQIVKYGGIKWTI